MDVFSAWAILLCEAGYGILWLIQGALKKHPAREDSFPLPTCPTSTRRVSLGNASAKFVLHTQVTVSDPLKKEKLGCGSDKKVHSEVV